MQFPEYMQRTFPGLQLGPDLFHRWTVGLRFELNSKHWPDIPWEVVLHRASTLYEAVFRDGDWGFIVSGHEFEFETKGHWHGKVPELRNSVFTLSRKQFLGLHGVAGRQRITQFEGRDTCVISTYRWAEMEVRRIGYKEILRTVMNTDFPSQQPRISGRVYFVNCSRNIVLHMYDDRGMDMIAPSVDDLRPIYEKHKDWILTYNRSSIEQIFESLADL